MAKPLTEEFIKKVWEVHEVRCDYSEQGTPLTQQDEWEDYFNQYRNDCQQLAEQIAQTDREIDLRVYQLYGLTDDEIKIVEGTD